MCKYIDYKDDDDDDDMPTLVFNAISAILVSIKSYCFLSKRRGAGSKLDESTTRR